MALDDHWLAAVVELSQRNRHCLRYFTNFIWSNRNDFEVGI
jgi:hypothetical protein